MAVPVKKSVPAKKAVPAKKSAPAKKSVPAKKAVPAKKSVPAKKAVPAKKSAPAKKSVPAKKAVPVKKTTVNMKEVRSMSKELAVGSGVMVKVDPRQNGGSDVAAGVVTKAGAETVNVRVLLDSEETQWLRDVTVVKSEPKDSDKEQGEDETASEAKVRQRVCWPAK